jgi:hypothetical protein
VGVLAWGEAAAQVWRLGGGLLGAGRHLERGRSALAAGSLKRGRLQILQANAAARDAHAGFATPNPLLDLAALVPQVGRALPELPHLVRAARSSTAAATGTLEVAQTALRGREKVIARDDEGAHVRVDRIEELRAQVARARRELRTARVALGEIDTSNLPGRARPAVKEGLSAARAGGRALGDAEAGLAVLPGILGADGPRWYLIGMQNSAELRGPGGALLRFALLRIDEGRTSLQSSKTVYEVDVDREPVDIPLPRDAWYVRGIEDAQRFGNANWSPDWPSSAKLTVAYGRASRGGGRKDLPPIAGAIAVDPPAMEELMPGVGKYRTEGGRTLTRSNVMPFLLHKAYAVHPRRGVRRSVLIDVVERFYKHLLDPAHPTDLLQGFGNALARKHMQIWLSERREQRYVERMGWDGGIDDAEGGDYLYVVQQNVGGNKLNYVERQAHSMDVRFSGRDAVVSTAVEISNDVVLPQPGYWLGDSEGLHRPMVNVYVPERARLVDADVRGTLSAGPAPAIWIGGRPPEHFEHEKKVWSATLEIPPQRSGRLNLRYRVPHALERRGGRLSYRLSIQHQPKVRPEDLRVRLALPQAARAVRAPGWKRSGRRIEWRGKVEEDMVLRVSWR